MRSHLLSTVRYCLGFPGGRAEPSRPTFFQICFLDYMPFPVKTASAKNRNFILVCSYRVYPGGGRGCPNGSVVPESKAGPSSAGGLLNCEM